MPTITKSGLTALRQVVRLLRRPQLPICGKIPVVSTNNREVVQLAERVLWEHEAAGSSPAFPTDAEISVKVNTMACGAINGGSKPLSQPKID